MRKVLTFLAASLSLTWVVAASAQDPKAPDMFKDVDQNHWAYPAVEFLRGKNIVVGYPDGYFRGKRTLTRYEFAVALERALKSIGVSGKGEKGDKGDTGSPGSTGEQGVRGDQGPPGMTPEEVATLRRLTQEFKDELAALGNSVTAINRKLDALGRAFADLKAEWDRAPKFYGGAFVGIRADRAHGNYVDHDGRPMGPAFGAGPGSLVNTPVVLNQFVLGVKANIAGGATIDAMLTSNNYKNYLAGNIAQIGGLNLAPAADTYLHHLEINTPFNGLGRGSKFTIGRYAEKLGHLTFYRPDVDTYFNNPFEDTGDYYLDGARLRTTFGSVSFEAFGGKFDSVSGTNGGPWNSPLAGTGGAFANMPFDLTGSVNGKPTGQPNQGQMTVGQAFGLSGGFGFNLFDKAGHLRVSALGLNSTMTPLVGFAGFPGIPGFPGFPGIPGIPATTPGLGLGPAFSNVIVLGMDGDLHLSDRLGLTLDYAKSITGTGRYRTQNPYQNNAFNANLGYRSGGMNVTAGYKYIDPLFYSPGYWGRIGNWLNPTNIQGPTFRAAYDFTPNLGVNVGGDFFSAARNRAPGGLGTNEDVTRALIGVRWGLTKGFNLTADYEGVFWALANARGGGGSGNYHPTEQYITLGTGYNLTSNTMLKLGYQIGDFNGHNGLGGGGMQGITKYNFNTFTGQVAVKF